MKVPEHRRQWTRACGGHESVYIRLNEYRIADFHIWKSANYRYYPSVQYWDTVERDPCGI